VSDLRITGGRPLRGRVRVPGDKSISHRALMLAALAEGTSAVRGLSDGDDVHRTRTAVEALGAVVEGERILGGRTRLHEAPDVIDVGNSGTTIRLLAGLCAGFDWLTVMTGDASIRRRPMARVAEPLRAMGAEVEGRSGTLPPLVVRGGGLKGMSHELTVPSAQVKSAILLAALSAEGETVVTQRPRTRAHTEELLALAGADVALSPDGLTVTVRPGNLRPFELVVPGDPSQAAFWLVAAGIVPGSDVVVENVYLGPARDGFVRVLARMGLAVERVGESDLRASYRGPLHATEVSSEEVPGLIDEIPVLAVAAAVADGTTLFSGVGELRVKESDRMAAIGIQLSALGAAVELDGDRLVVHGTGGRLRATHVDSGGDHRMAMALAVAGLAADGETWVGGWDAVTTSYPRFEDDLRGLLQPCA
jgi:3-phosphoshikimate 1-carboxyvinyltransferase